MIKNYILRAAAMFTLLCGAVAVSCSSGDDGKEPVTPPVDPTNPIAATYSRCEYKGDFAGKGTDVFNLIIATGQVNASGEAAGEGYIFNLNLNSLVSGAAKPIPANGTYNFDAANTFAANTISSNMSKATGYDKALKATAYSFSAAQVIVTKDGENFTVSGEVTLNTNVKIAFTATVTNWVDLSEGGEDGDDKLTKDINLTLGAVAPIGFRGNLESGAAVYSLLFGETTKGPYINAIIFGPEVVKFDKTAIPTGTFTLNESMEAYTALSGSMDQDGMYGTIYDDDAGIYGFCKTGTVTITKNGANYDVKFDTKNAKGIAIKATFTGPLSMKNETIMSSMTKDHTIDFSSVSSADAVYAGDEVLNTTYGHWIINLNPKKANKEGFSLWVLSPATVADGFAAGIPTGEFNYDENLGPNSYFPGLILEDGGIVGTYFYTVYEYSSEGVTIDIQGENSFAPAAGGKINIEKTVAGYKITINIIDDAGFTTSGIWEGPITTVDGTAPAAAPAKAAKRANKKSATDMFKTSKQSL